MSPRMVGRGDGVYNSAMQARTVTVDFQMQDKRRELKNRLLLLLENIEQVKDLIRTRSDLRYITLALKNTNITQNGFQQY